MTLLKIGRLAAATTLVQKRFASNASEEKAQLAKLDSYFKNISIIDT